MLKSSGILQSSTSIRIYEKREHIKLPENRSWIEEEDYNDPGNIDIII